ncbi:MAG: Gfo/Idh/MocA family oxidoreductase [Gemmataceae bacterium]
MTHPLSRRDVLAASAAAGLGYFVSETPARDKDTSPLERLRFACIGIGGKGGRDTADAAQHGDVVAICDVDDQRLEKAGEKYGKAQKFHDFRRLFDKLGKSIDAVTVSTPDHTHAPATALALRMGKHCFTQKPLTRTIWEARRLGELARENKVVTQMGNQGTASSGLRKAAAIIRAGTLGKVTEVHVWTNRPVWPQGIKRPATAAVPASLQWDLWLGPSPERPFGPGYHPFAWRGWWDFGSGPLGDMACHTLNMPFMALDLREPTAVEATSAGHDRDSMPKWSIITFTFPARGKRGPVKVVWYDGGKKPDRDLFGKTDLEIRNSGSLVIGEKGKLYSPGDNGTSHHLIGDLSEPKVEITTSPGHFTEWVKGIKGGPTPVSNFPDYAGPLTETILLGNLAVYAGKKIEWDARAVKATNTSEVDHLIRPVYRKGWEL